MKISHSFLIRLSLCAVAFCSLAACNDDEFEDIYGDGAPLAANVVEKPDYVYEYNEQGLVTKVSARVLEIDGSTGQTGERLEEVATVTYPQSNRAVLVYTDIISTTYVFAFGENHFANRVIETDDDGETYMTTFTYDGEGHVTSLKRPGEELRLQWTNGNLTRLEQDEHGASAVLTYGSGTDFDRYGMSPFLLDVRMGPFMDDLDWWFDRGLGVALYLGFLGHPSVNLPATLTSYDEVNSSPERVRFVYNDYGGGMWTTETISE